MDRKSKLYGYTDKGILLGAVVNLVIIVIVVLASVKVGWWLFGVVIRLLAGV